MEMSEKISEVVRLERAHLGSTKQVMLSTLFSEEVVSAGRRLKVEDSKLAVFKEAKQKLSNTGSWFLATLGICCRSAEGIDRHRANFRNVFQQSCAIFFSVFGTCNVDCIYNIYVISQFCSSFKIIKLFCCISSQTVIVQLSPLLRIINDQ